MPWIPEVFSAPIAEEIHASANDAVHYYEGILADEPDALARSFAKRQPVLYRVKFGGLAFHALG